MKQNFLVVDRPDDSIRRSDISTARGQFSSPGVPERVWGSIPGVPESA